MKHMRKYRTLGLTILTVGALLLPLPAAAAENSGVSVYRGSLGRCNYKVIVIGKNCSLPDPETPEIPGTDLPETPDSSLPDAPEAEVPDTPETDAPGAEQPETENPGDTGSEDDLSSSAYIRRVVKLVNIERAKEGLAPLTLETKMTDAAMTRAKEIQISFSHTRPDGSSFATALREAGVSYSRAGENIAWGQSTPEKVVNAWMNSSGHRANIMSANFSRIGVGYLTNASGTPYWVQLFAN